MKLIKRIFEGKKGTLILFAAAAILLACSVVEPARAALTYFSNDYTMQMEIQDIGGTLVEKSAKGTKDISSRDYLGSDDRWRQTSGALLTDMLKETDGELVIGRSYKEELSVRNTGTIDEYVRVRIFKSWTDENGNKVTTLAPSLIELNMTNNGWIIDKKASTEERTVLYWPHILKVGESTAALCDSITISNAIMSKVTETTETKDGLTTITTTYCYDGMKFNVEAEVDAVQTHNAATAIKSAWGVDVNVSRDGTLSLVK